MIVQRELENFRCTCFTIIGSVTVAKKHEGDVHNILLEL